MDTEVLIIGSGPGGYVAAIRCAQLGLKVTIVEKYLTLGGTCLNVGCIPSKALLDSSEHYHNAIHRFKDHGLLVGEIKIDMPAMIKRKNEVVDQTCKGVQFLMKKNKIQVLQGIAGFISSNEVNITKPDGTIESIKTKYTIIATGSKPITPAAFNYDKKRIITSTEALNISPVPGHMVIIGAGVIGLELGSVYARLGTKVEVIEYLDRILPGMDTDCAKELQKLLEKLGITFHLNHAVQTVDAIENKVNIKFKFNGSDEIKNIESEYCLIAIGRRPYTEGLNPEKAGVKLDEKGRVIIDEQFRTSNPNIFAIGDVVQGAMLAHKASEEGIAVAEIILGQQPHIDHNLIPGVVYTWPELSSVGQTEEKLKAQNIAYNVGKFPFKALGRSRASMDTEGFVKILSDKNTDEVLGVHILGPRAADLIMEAVTIMEFKGSAEDIARISHPHPTYSEAMKEAAYAAWTGKALHL
ncbi:MAG: dihydrolipoyl dehydrogenase [Saprospiraceae bacterium]